MAIRVALIGLCILNWVIPKKRNYYYIFAVVVLTGLSMFFVPTEDMDLYRHYEMLDQMRQEGLFQTVALHSERLGTMPVFALFFYLVSLTGFNQLLPMTAFAVVYGLQFALIAMIRKDRELSLVQEKLAATLVLLLTNALTITGIRTPIACIVVLYFMYWELVRKEKRVLCWVMYIAMLLLHDGMILLIGLRLVTELIHRRAFRQLMLLVLVWPWVLDFGVELLRSSQVDYLVAVAVKLELYASDYAASLWASNKEYSTMNFLRLVLTFITLLRLRRLVAQEGGAYEVFYGMLGLFCMAGTNNMALTGRYLTMVMQMLPPAMLLWDTRPLEIRTKAEKIESWVFWGLVMAAALVYFRVLIPYQYDYFNLEPLWA